ncbi:MAG: GNAT family N-acetyltransferase [Candidatus Magasanikbacteria bacterium]|nr:GNAT family N-acetyltransferase [Candidatus Magasanikbacteria bacterium]
MITLARAKPKESQAIRRLEQRVWRASNITSPYDIAFYVRFGYAWIARDAQRLIGAIVALKTRNDEVKIVDWVVEPKYRRRGIGERLYRALERASRGLPIIALVKETNRPSLRAHQKLGFKPVRAIRDPFALGSKKRWWLMRKN